MNLLTSTVKQFLARSDVEAAVKLISKVEPNQHTVKAQAYIREYWPGYFDSSEYDRIYHEAGIIESAVDAFNTIPAHWRYQMAKGILLGTPKEDRILDFGCSRGLYAINLHNEVGKRWMCMDIDPLSIDCARDLCQRHANKPSAVELAGT